MGCCVTRLGACMLQGSARQGRYDLLFQGKSAPVYCGIKPAESRSYWKRLKYHWCPMESNEAVFFQLLSDGHLYCHWWHWSASLLIDSVSCDIKSYLRDCQSTTTGTAQQQVFLFTSELKLTDDELGVELPFHSPFCLYKKTLLSRIFSLALHTALSFRQ